MCKEIDTFLNRSSPSQPQIHEKNFTKMYLKSYHSARRNMVISLRLRIRKMRGRKPYEENKEIGMQGKNDKRQNKIESSKD